MFDHEDLLLVYMTQAVDNLYTKTVNYRPNIENFDDLIVNVEVPRDSTTKLKAALTLSHEITFDALRDEVKRKHMNLAARADDSVFEVAAEEVERAPLTTAEKLFFKDEHWLCTTCG